MPPRLSMDEYATWIGESLRHANPRHIERQKAIEKRIEARFCLTEPRETAPSRS